MPQNPYQPFSSDLGSIVTLTAASSGGTSAKQVSGIGRGLQIRTNISALSGTSPTLTVTVQGYDAASGSYFTLLQSTALSSTGLNVLNIYPGIAAAANSAVNGNITPYWRVSYAIGGTSPSITGTIGASVLI